MAVASLSARAASVCRPSACNTAARMFRLWDTVRAVAAGRNLGQLMISSDCFVDYRQRVLGAAGLEVSAAQVEQGKGQVWPVPLTHRCYQLPADRYGFLNRRKCTLHVAGKGEIHTEIDQSTAVLVPGSCGAPFREVTVDADGFLGHRQRVLQTTRIEIPDAEMSQGSGPVLP